MSCKRLTLKKYTSRPSPPFHAGECKGKTLKGNDGRQYKSVTDSHGVYTWKPVKGTSRTTRKRKLRVSKHYETHDNGSRPFLVTVFPESREFAIHHNKYYPEYKKYLRGDYIMSGTYKDLLVGDDKKGYGDYGRFKSRRAPGNSVLVEMRGGKFIFIGWKVYSFKLEKDDSPVEYVSYVGLNDVPYPYLIGETHTYLLIDAVAIPNEFLNLDKDAYGQYYMNPDLKKETKKIDIELIAETN